MSEPTLDDLREALTPFGMVKVAEFEAAVLRDAAGRLEAEVDVTTHIYDSSWAVARLRTWGGAGR